MNPAIDALNSVGVSIKDMAGNVKPVSDILSDLASRWTSLTDEQRQNLGVTLAGRYQLTRFLALMNNFKIAQSATATAISSTGSSMKEQEKYSDSLQARINRLDTAWSKLTMSFGRAFLTDGIIGGVESLNDMATSASKVVNTIGVLPGVFSILGVTTLALSTKFRTFSTSLIFGVEGMTRAQLASAGLTAGMTRLGIATVGLKTAFRGLVASTVVGAAFVVLGYVIEKLINSYSKAKQAQEEFDKSQQKGIDALTANKQQTEKMIDQYNGLTEAKKKAGESWSVKQEEQYVALQNKLATIYPQLISYVDGAGNSHLKSKEQIDKEVEATERLIAAKKEEMQLKATDTFEKEKDKLKDLQDQIEAKQNAINLAKKTPNSSNPDGSGMYKDNADVAKEIAKRKVEIVELQNKWADGSQKINSEVLKIADTYTSLKIQPNIKQSVDDFVQSLDFSKLNPAQLKQYSKNIGEITDNLQKAYSSKDSTAFDKAKQDLIDYAQSMGATKQQAFAFGLTLDGVQKSVKDANSIIYAGQDGMNGLDDSAGDLTGAMDGLSNAVDGTTNAMSSNVTAAQMLFGVTSDQIQQAQNAIAIVAALAGQEGLDAQQKAMLAQATAVLASMYPQLNGQISQNIGWISSQIGMMSSLNDVSGANAYTMIANQNSTTKATISQINQRIAGYQKEAQALSTLMANIEAAYETEGMSGAKTAAYTNAQKRLAALNAQMAAAQASRIEAYYNSGVKTGQVKPYNPSSSGSDSKKDAANSANDKAKQDKQQFLDDIVQMYKDAYEKEKTIALDALDKEKTAYEKAHQAKMDNLDAELSKYEKIIQAQMDSIDKQEEAESYNKRLNDAQKGRQAIIDEINKLQMDNSFAGRKRLDELNVQLAESNSGITDMQHQNEVQQRKDNLQTLLDNKTTSINTAKDKEQTAYDAKMAYYDKQQAYIERKYDNLINNERAFAKLKTDITKGNNKTILDQINKFYTIIAKNTTLLGESVSQNFLDLLNQAKTKIKGKKFTPITSLDTGGFTGNFGSSLGKLAVLHEKEIVLNKSDTSNFLKAIDITRNLVNNIKIPQLPVLNPSPSMAGGIPLTLNFNVAKMTGSQDDVNFFMNQIVKGVNSMGGKM